MKYLEPVVRVKIEEKRLVYAKICQKICPVAPRAVRSLIFPLSLSRHPGFFPGQNHPRRV